MTMNLADESWLSAYLDGELDPAARARVEAAVLADARLAERLQELAAVRGLLGALPRPTVEADQAPQVRGRIEATARWRLRQARRARPVRSRLLTTGAGLAAAAALLVALWPTLRGTPDRVGRVASAPFPTVAVPKAIDPEAAPGVEAIQAEPVPSPAAPAGDSQRSRDRQRLLTFLEAPSVRRLTVSLPNVMPQTYGRIGEALADTGRAERLQGELRLGPGLVIDADRPETPVVFVARMNGRELADFGAKLKRLVPEAVETVEDADPALAMLLADAGTVAFREGQPVPGLGSPPEGVDRELATVHNPLADPLTIPLDQPPARVPTRDAPEARPAPGAIESVAADDPARVYLIWVAPRADGPESEDR